MPEARETLEFSSIREVSEVVDQTPRSVFNSIGAMISAAAFFGPFIRKHIGHALIALPGKGPRFLFLPHRITTPHDALRVG